MEGVIFVAELLMAQPNNKILYLEDDEFTRLLVQSQLKRAGFSVESFSSYKDLVIAVTEKNYDLIITDLNINGHSPSDLIRDMRVVSEAPIVVLSGSDKPVRQADLSISKPLTAEKIEQITRLLQRGPANVDLSKVYRFACGDEKLLLEYVNTFIENYEEDLSVLKTAVKKNDITAIRNRAHKMLSSVAYYSYKPLNDLFQYMEQHTGPMDPDQLQQWFSEVEKYSLDLISNVQQKMAI